MAESIKKFLDNKIEEFELASKVFCTITDNGANMKKAIRIWNGVERLPCTAHTLQLTVLQALKVINPYIKQTKKLISFFQSSKQCQRLD